MIKNNNSKKLGLWGIIKRTALILCGCGICLFPVLSITGAKIYSGAEQNVEKILVENGYEGKVNFDKDKEKVNEFINTSENISEKEYSKCKEAMKKAKVGENLMKGGLVAGPTGLGAGFVAAFAKLQEDDKKRELAF